MANASSVPIETSSPSRPIGSSPATTIATPPVSTDATHGVRKRGWTSPKIDGSRPSRAIVKKMRGWPSSITRITDERPGDGADLHDRAQPREAGPRGVDADGDRVGHVERVEVDDAGQHQRDGDVEHRADRERAEDADRHVALWVASLPARRSRPRRSRCRRRRSRRRRAPRRPSRSGRCPPRAG